MLKQALKGEPTPNLVEEPVPGSIASATATEKDSGEKADRQFSQDELRMSWLQFAEQQKTNEPRMYSILITNIPEKREDSVLKVRLANRSQETHFNEIKNRLVNFLHRELQNSKIDIELEVIESENTENKLYTTKDKYDYLVQKNPALASMKQQLNLDFD
ncbi:MAG: hypothetical protein K9H64_23035 [Bacteroidales bacterium]|nr:hypothetical protein [Bacteroidales bacterium]MCF8458907.1 hypothetical protein [Bacteroidales bacterium]